MAGRLNFEEFCDHVVQKMNQEKALGDGIVSYDDAKIRVMERGADRTVSTGLRMEEFYDWYVERGDSSRVYADIKENLQAAMEEFHVQMGDLRVDKESIMEA